MSSEEKIKIGCHGCQQKLDVSDLEPFIKIRCPICNTEIIVPKSFGNLLLEEPIGEGYMAEVFRAIDLTLDREIAVKMLKPEIAKDADLAYRFINEARTSSAVNHPNIIPIYSCGDMDDQPYIVMQYLDGGSLRDRLERGTGSVPVAEICRWFREAAKGLESASIHGVLHHDIRPANIFLDSDGNVKVSDFGLTHILHGDEPVYDDANNMNYEINNLHAQYLSPEKISTGRNDIAGEIYSFGATFYHVITEHELFSGSSIIEVLNARFSAAPPPPRQLRPDIPDEINDLIMKMLAIYPSDRPASYSAILDVLNNYLDQTDEGANTSDELELVPVPETKPEPPPAPKNDSKTNTTRKKRREFSKSQTIHRKKKKKGTIHISDSSAAKRGRRFRNAQTTGIGTWVLRLFVIIIFLLLIFFLYQYSQNPAVVNR